MKTVKYMTLCCLLIAGREGVSACLSVPVFLLNAACVHVARRAVLGRAYRRPAAAGLVFLLRVLGQSARESHIVRASPFLMRPTEISEMATSGCGTTAGIHSKGG